MSILRSSLSDQDSTYSSISSIGPSIYSILEGSSMLISNSTSSDTLSLNEAYFKIDSSFVALSNSSLTQAQTVKDPIASITNTNDQMFDNLVMDSMIASECILYIADN